jgi:hypothetical protein
MMIARIVRIAASKWLRRLVPRPSTPKTRRPDLRSTGLRALPAVFLLLPFVGACLGADATAPRFGSGVRVLFVGNSLTYYNDLGDMMSAAARSVGDTAVRTATVAFGNFALVDHMGEGSAVSALKGGTWEYVVMQQGPSSRPENQLLLLDGARAFEPHIRAAGAEPVMYMVWPAIDRLVDFPAVRTSYRNAAAGVHGIFAPVGDAWTIAWEIDPSLRLYDGDGVHPTPAGTYLAAIVILHQIRGIVPTSLPARIPGHPASADVVRTLQQAAVQAIGRNPLRP